MIASGQNTCRDLRLSESSKVLVIFGVDSWGSILSWIVEAESTEIPFHVLIICRYDQLSSKEYYRLLKKRVEFVLGSCQKNMQIVIFYCLFCKESFNSNAAYLVRKGTQEMPAHISRVRERNY